jgi:hypothetical protein
MVPLASSNLALGAVIFQAGSIEKAEVELSNVNINNFEKFLFVLTFRMFVLILNNFS